MKNIEQAHLKITKGKEIVYDGTGISDLTSLMTDSGTYQFEIRYNLQDKIMTGGNRTYTFTVVLQTPVRVSLSIRDYQLGDLVTVDFENVDKNKKIRLEPDFETSVAYHQLEDQKGVASIPIGLSVPVGQHTITVTCQDEPLDSFVIQVQDPQFPQQEKDPLLFGNEEQQKELTDLYQELRKEKESDKLFEDTFLLPVQGAIGTPFGTYWTHQGTVIGREQGIVIQSSNGSVVKATASGKVVVAKGLSIPGNYVVIDHGYGILSYYSHLKQIDVQVGQTLKAGDTIGEVGDTGLLTESQLGFQISVNHVFVSPWNFIKQ